ncbi:PIN domain-containing protein [Curtobacterium sp. MCBA15_001]|uniref:type II toxin-antitoxin system VapC family toxin n=1 Tax=Curtobacterium sp. MCBA15_001 TaxID=1898731 RepID=UPI0008DC869D|nr:PIN domain-containing protein [Curtobacterium sp. MCBA15_001]OIH92822.1 hypothetical protein BIU90_10015 [Curtobacterium sp. MCBA15_001]
MITLDANVMIARFDHHDASHERAVDVLDHHEWEEYLTSAVTLAEALVHPARISAVTKALRDLESLNILVVPVEDDDPVGIAALCARHQLQTPDAVVLHTAITTSDALVTFDTRLARAARAAGFPVIERAPGEPDWGPLIAA